MTKRKIRWHKAAHLLKLMIACAILLVPFSCNEEMVNRLTAEYPASGTNYKSGKVLLIVVDGASGKAINEACNKNSAPNITSILPNSMYTFEGLADSKSALSSFSEDRGWANLMTGVTTHNVGEGIAKISEMTQPSFLKLLKQGNVDLKSSLYASDSSFYNVFSKDVDKAVGHGGANDELVRDSLISELGKSNSSPSDVIVAEFKGVELSGRESGFYDASGAPTANIISAVKTVDSHIGKILKTLKSRPNFVKENWVVIITSNYGGVGTSSSVSTYYDYPDRNTFSLMYNSRFAYRLLQKPAADELTYPFFSPIWGISGYTDYAKVNDPTLFNVDWSSKGSKSGYTIQFMIRTTTTTEENGGQVFVSKADATNSSKGWVILSDYNYFKVRIGGSTVWSEQNYTRRINDGKWHTATFVFDKPKNRFRMYTDGIYNMHSSLNSTHGFSLTGLNPGDLTDPLTINKIANSVTDKKSPYYLTNLQFYNVALPENFIKANSGRTRLEELGNEYWGNLMGYWPNDREEDFQENKLRDYSKYAQTQNGKSDLYFGGNVVWGSGESLEPNILPTPTASFYKKVFNTVDISYQIFDWLGVSVDSSWKLEGQGWTFNYSAIAE